MRWARYVGVSAMLVLGSFAFGQTLRVAISGEPADLDTRFSSGQISNIMLATIYEPLFTRADDGSLQGQLAESWEWEDDETLRIRLREGVTFHDGTPYTADDAKVTLETIADPEFGSVQRTYLGNIIDVEVVDSHEIRIHATPPAAPLTSFLTYYGFQAPGDALVPNDDGVDLRATPIGTGPFKFVEYVPGVRFVVERNDEYWGDLPDVEGIVFYIISEAGTRVAALESGDVDIALQIPAEAVDLLRGGGFTVDVGQTIAATHLVFDVTNTPTDDVRVRRAIGHAIDKEALALAFGGPESEVAKAIFGPGVFGRAEQQPLEYDPDLARRLIQEAGADGATLEFIISLGAFGGSPAIGEAIGEYLRQVGLNVQVQPLERSTFVERVYRIGRTVNVWAWSWRASTLDPDELLRREFDPDRGPEWLTYTNEELTNVIQLAAHETDVDARVELYRRAQEILWEDVPWIPLYNLLERVAYRPGLDGVATRSGGAFFTFELMRLPN